MNSLPVSLTYGLVSVYGNGYSFNGIIDATGWSGKNLWGVIDQLSDSSPASLAIGDNVLYNVDEILSSVQYVYNEFNIFPWSKIIAKETALP